MVCIAVGVEGHESSEDEDSLSCGGVGDLDSSRYRPSLGSGISNLGTGKFVCLRESGREPL